MFINERTGIGNFVDVIDRVLDRGIVIDAWMRVSLTGIDLMTIETRVVVASIETYLKHAPPVRQALPLSSAVAPAARPSERSLT